MDLAQLRRDAGLAREQLLKIVQEDTPFSYRKFTSLGGKGLTARLDNLVPDDYIVIVNNKNKEDYYRLPYKSFLNLLDIYQDELEDRRNRGASKIAQIKKRAQGNREKGKPDLFLQNERLFSILDRTRDAVKLSQSKREAETFTALASKPVGPPPPPEPKKIEEGFSAFAGTLYKSIVEDGISYLVDEDNNVYNDEYDELGVWDGEDVEWNNNQAWKSHKRKMMALPEYDPIRGGVPDLRRKTQIIDASWRISDPKPLPEPDSDDDEVGSVAYRREHTMDYYLVVDGEETDFPYVVNPAGEIFDDNFNIIAQLTDYPNDLKTYEWIDEKQHKKNIRAYEGRFTNRRKKQEEEPDNSTMKIIYEGVEYDLLAPEYDTLSDLEGIIVYNDEIEEMGTWVVGGGRGGGRDLDPSGDIKFTPDGAAAHLSDPKMGSTDDGITKLVLPKNIPDWFPQASSPEPEPQPQEESEDELNIEDIDDDEDDTITLRYEGVFYGIESDMSVIDDDFDDVGKWVNGDIKFTKQGAKVHKNLRDTSADKIEWLSDKRPK